MTPKVLRVEMMVLLIPQNCGLWVAQGMEYDIAAQGKTIEDTLDSFRLALESQIVANVTLGKEPLQDVPRAPREYWETYNRLGKKVAWEPELRVEGLPPAWLIAASLPEIRVA